VRELLIEYYIRSIPTLTNQQLFACSLTLLISVEKSDQNIAKTTKLLLMMNYIFVLYINGVDVPNKFKYSLATSWYVHYISISMLIMLV